MAIIVNLDIMMARRKISLGELAEKVDIRSEEHTSELQSHSFISDAGFCLKKKKIKRSGFLRLKLFVRSWIANREIFWSIRKATNKRRGFLFGAI